MEKFSDFQIGDVVYLKSGSPPMTVVEKYEGTENSILAFWTANGEPQETLLDFRCFTKAGTRA